MVSFTLCNTKAPNRFIYHVKMRIINISVTNVSICINITVAVIEWWFFVWQGKGFGASISCHCGLCFSVLIRPRNPALQKLMKIFTANNSNITCKVTYQHQLLWNWINTFSWKYIYFAYLRDNNYFIISFSLHTPRSWLMYLKMMLSLSLFFNIQAHIITIFMFRFHYAKFLNSL